jgi:hypothetical protein
MTRIINERANQREYLKAAGAIRHNDTLEEAYLHARKVFRGSFVYRGGSHIAIHRGRKGDRIILVVEV